MQLKCALLLGVYIQFAIASELVPSTLFGFKIKRSTEKVPSIDTFKNLGNDIIAPLVFAQLLPNQNDSVNNNLIIMYNNLGHSTNKFLELIEIINVFAGEWSVNTCDLTDFIDKRYQYYAVEKNDNSDPLERYLKVFKDAKIVYYALSIIKKCQDQEILFSSEQRFITENLALLVWACKNGHKEIRTLGNECNVRDPFQHLGGLASNCPELLLYYAKELCSVSAGMTFVYKDIVSCLGIVSFGICCVILQAARDYVQHHPFNNTVLCSRYFLKDDQIISIEEMDTVIEASVFE
ncbi:hypothetical protein EKK58_06485 [Candidatus Dependentiae bacterium]|nr:MAG: hypothetical protein EKK58_06485 [Candidatus Dependentiae bacterium]